MNNNRIEVPASPEVVAAWHSHFSEIEAGDPNALTSGELAELAGVAVRTMQTRLNAGVRMGKYILSKVARRRLDGAIKIVPAYTLVKKSNAKN